MDGKELEVFLKSQIFNEEEQTFLNKCSKIFNEVESRFIKKAYVYARDLHHGQLRESGEEYITHPLRVANILLEEIKLVDANSICAALLHDTIEDTGVDKYFLSTEFNNEVALLVDGVTKIKDINLKTKSERDNLNNAIMLRRILASPKIILIKLADRLHNMRTLEYKNNPNKRKNKALETFSLFVPIAKMIGARKIFHELEDDCFFYLSPSDYKNIKNIRDKYIERNGTFLVSLKEQINDILKGKIGAIVDFDILNVYGIYEGLKKAHKLKKIPELTTIKIITQSKEDCYEAFLALKNSFLVFNINNYIKSPMINGFQGLTFYINSCSLKQFIRVEICTKNMALVNDYGYAGHFLIHHDTYQNVIDNTFFMLSLKKINQKYREDQTFFESVNKKLLVDQMKILTPKGKGIWLPIGGTVKEFAYQIHSEVGKNAVGAYVNNILVDVDFVLHEGDVVEVITHQKMKDEIKSLKRIL